MSCQFSSVDYFGIGYMKLNSQMTIDFYTMLSAHKLRNTRGQLCVYSGADVKDEVQQLNYTKRLPENKLSKSIYSFPRIKWRIRTADKRRFVAFYLRLSVVHRRLISD